MTIRLQEFTIFFNAMSFEIYDTLVKLYLTKNSFNQEFMQLINYFLSKKIILESNFHNIYILFTFGLSVNLSGFLDILIKTCFETYKIFFSKRRFQINKKEEVILQSLGAWLKKIFDLNLILLPIRYMSIFDSIFKEQRWNFILFNTSYLLSVFDFPFKSENLMKKSNFFKIKKISAENFNFIFYSKKLKLFLEKICKHNLRPEKKRGDKNSINIKKYNVPYKIHIDNEKNKFKNFCRNFQVITYKKFDFYIRNDWFFHRKTFQLLFRSIEIIFNRKNSLGNIGGKFLERNRFLKLNSFFKNQKIEKRYNNFIKHLIFDFVKEKKFFVFFLILGILNVNQRFQRIFHILTFLHSFKKTQIFKFHNILDQNQFYLTSVIKCFRKEIHKSLHLVKGIYKKKIPNICSVFRPKI